MIGTAGEAGTTVEGTDGFPLSRGQERPRFLDRPGPCDAAYHIPLMLRMHGDLSEPAPRAAFDRTAARCEPDAPAARDQMPAEIEALTEEDAERLLAPGSGPTGAERNGTLTA
ncbi:hypothetical protein AB0M42_09735 [Streptomyces sp. NPDC051784]|uniref:hypothetical protein n=1 Tax=Streptomyces sp. NPDC051784 TaxID=3155805 RepID=UPI0034254C06